MTAIYVKESENGVLKDVLIQNAVAPNPQKAFYWAKKAADNNDIGSMCNLGIYYVEGLGTAPNVPLGIAYLEKAASAGNVNAQFNLGNYYRLGEYVSQNYNKAVYWYRLASEQGDAPSKNSLAVIYREVYERYDESFELFRQAAEMGNRY